MPQNPGEDRSRLDEAALRLVRSRLERKPLIGLEDSLRPRDEGEAYAVQDLAHGHLTARGRGARLGWKIGCTTEVMQRYLGIPNPCAGGVFETTVHRLAGRFQARDHQRVGVECEIAVRLARDLAPDAQGGVTREAAAAAVGACMAAIEVVEDRYRDYRSLDTPTLIADDFFNAGCVLGEEGLDVSPLDLAAVAARMEVNGREVGRGVGSDVLGHPLEALRWLGTFAARRGRPLKGGEFVLLGSLVQTVWIEAGDEVVIGSDRLGKVSLRLAEG